MAVLISGLSMFCDTEAERPSGSWEGQQCYCKDTDKLWIWKNGAWASSWASNFSGGGGSPPTGTGWRHVTNGVEDEAASTPTKADVGLGSCDNTADSAKPISTAQQAALNTKARIVYNASVSNQGPGFASDTYLTGSSIAIPSGSLQAKSIYRCRFALTKTAAGTATPIINVRFGTNGSTADTSRGTLTFSAQTAAADEGVFEVVVVFRTVGSGTSAVIQSSGQLRHRLSITGFGTGVSEPEAATSAGFDSTVANSIIGLSVNGGTSAAWTVTQVTTELLNLV